MATSKVKYLFVFGTRPEAIKLAPLIIELKRKKWAHVIVCVTAQHRQMLDQVLDLFEIRTDYDLNIMQPGQSLTDVTINCLQKISPVIETVQPDFVFVQGDTTTVFAASLACYYRKTKVIHVEAGLRSFDKFSPFPEEINRILTTHLADLHFCPTTQAVKNLKQEGVKKGIYKVGNTVIDALLIATARVKKNNKKFEAEFPFLTKGKRLVLITCHRRENFGKPFLDICKAIKELALLHPDVEWVFPVHLNPNIQKVAHQQLSKIEPIYLIQPLDYLQLVYLMNRSYLVLTDSGGIQEEAPTLGKPVLVLRENTERPEGVKAGTAVLVGSETKKIVSKATKLLQSKRAYNKMAKAVNPYGDGSTAAQIIQIIENIRK